jgi:hypothetical protein
VGGIEGGSLRFSIEFADVNGDQTVEAPANSRPLSELTSQLGAGALNGGLGGLGGGAPSGEQEQPPAGSAEPPAAGGGAGTPRTPQAPPGVENFQNYANCLDQAEPDDTEALQRCSALLQP